MSQYKYWMVHSASGGACQKVYSEMKAAIDEAKRLATANPGRRFCVMETALCYEVKQPEPTVVRIEMMPECA